MQIEILNNFLGDNLVEIDPDSEDGKQRIAELFMKLLKSGTAIHLERADKTYRVTGYDQATDTIKVMVPIPPRLPLSLPPAPAGVEHDLTTKAGMVAWLRERGRMDGELNLCDCQRCEGCENIVRETSKTGTCSACQQNKHGGRKLESRRGRNRVVPARPRHQRGDRVTAVAPRAGG